MSNTIWAVDGSFFAQRISGIQRYSIELLAALDEMAPAGLVELVVPPQVKIRFMVHSSKIFLSPRCREMLSTMPISPRFTASAVPP